MSSLNKKKEARLKRKLRIRKRIFGSGARPRLSVFRSAKHIYAQIVDDTNGHTLAAASTLDKAVKEHQKFANKIAVAEFVGKLIAIRAKEKGLTKVVFDRNGFLYHGRIKALSNAAREGGLEF